MDVLWKNFIYSARMLLKKPSLTAVAILAIGLGIGANTAIFSVVNTVLLQPLPFPQPKQLVNIGSEQRNQALDGRGAFSVPDVLGVKPELGRTFTPDEDKPGAASVVLISHALWQRRYAGDPNIIGREIDLGGKSTVVGVMPAGFEFPISDENQDSWARIFSAPFMTT